MQPSNLQIPESKVALILEWIGRKLTAMAEDFPEEKYDFKQTLRSVVCRAVAARGGCMLLLHESCDGAKSLPQEDLKRDQYKSKADIVAFVKKSFADGATAIQSKGEKGLTTEVVYSRSAESARYRHCIRPHRA